MKRLLRIALPFAPVLVAACAASEVPPRQLADSQAAIRAAQELGADRNPQASLHLRMAQDRVAKAQQLGRQGEGEAARRLLEQAEIDAELAVALTRRQQAAIRAQHAREQLGSLD